MKVLEFKRDKKSLEELKNLLNQESFTGFIFAGERTDGQIEVFASGDSVLKLNGMLAYLEKDVRSQIDLL